MQPKATGSATPDLQHDASRSRYEARLDGKVVAHARYHLEGDRVVFTHTEVDSDHEGQGLGSQVVAYALDDVRRQGRKAVPKCEFIASYIARHEQEYGDLVPR